MNNENKFILFMCLRQPLTITLCCILPPALAAAAFGEPVPAVHLPPSLRRPPVFYFKNGVLGLLWHCGLRFRFGTVSVSLLTTEAHQQPSVTAIHSDLRKRDEKTVLGAGRGGVGDCKMKPFI